ncbi:MAG: hypothetical protein ABFS05_02110 [Bacteroidota bacterium]
MKNILALFIIISVFVLWSCSGNSHGEKQAGSDDPTIADSKQADNSDEKNPPAYYSPFDSRYSGGGFFALIDGQYGSLSFADGKWQGFRDNGLDVVIDMGAKMKLSSVSGNFLQNHETWAFLPALFVVLTSNNMQDYSLQGEITTKPPAEFQEPGAFLITVDSLDVEARYVRVQAKSIGPIPEWHNKAKGKPSWIFIDEIIIE